MKIEPQYKVINGITYKYYISKNGLKIQKVGTSEIYVDAIDELDAPWEYIETDVPIEIDEEQSNGE